MVGTVDITVENNGEVGRRPGPETAAEIRAGVFSLLLPHSVQYSQADPRRHPMSARKLRDAGWHEVRYGWLHIPSGREGVSTLWVPVAQWAAILIGFWTGSAWKYWETH